MKFTRRDLVFSIVTGLVTGVVAWRVFGFLGIPTFGDVSFAWLIILVPIAWIAGVNLGYFLGRWFSFFNQFGKFTAIGFTNSAVDFGVLNLLIAFSGLTAGVWFAIFKGISFVAAATHGYFWNKYWSFEAGGGVEIGREFIKYFLVAALGLLINVGIASFVVNFIAVPQGFSPQQWANIGAVAGAAIALAFSFIGFKLLVFKK